MDDLISRDKLIEELDLAIANGRIECDQDVFDIIDEQPTAYDVEKVVAELEEMEAVADIGECRCDARAFGVAIGIVKRGGIEESREE